MTNREIIAFVQPTLPHVSLDITLEGKLRITKPFWFTIGPIDKCKLSTHIENWNGALQIRYRDIEVELYREEWRAPFIIVHEPISI